MNASWEECHAAGMTAIEAAQARGCNKWNAYKWASDNGVSWVKITPDYSNRAKTSAPPLDAPLSEPDVDACRKLWIEVLADQWSAAFPEFRVNTRYAVTEHHIDYDARAWFGTRDCATVCALAGLDSEAVMDRFYAMIEGKAA